jgi:hypothetical protein
VTGSGGGLTGGGDLQAQSGVAGVGDPSSMVGGSSGQLGAESMNAQMGMDGNVTADGGARGVVESQLQGGSYDAGGKAQFAAQAESLDQRDAGQVVRDEAIERSGQGGRVGEAYAAQDRAAEVKYAAANPSETAMGEARYRAAGEAEEHTPDAAKTAMADANVARDTASNPEAAGKAQVNVRVEGAEYEQESKLGVTGVVPPSGGGTDKK